MVIRSAAMARPGVVSAVLLLALFGASAPSARTAEAAAPAAAQGAAPSQGAEWEFSAVANGYLLPDEENFLLGIVTADRGPLHLEARYNYEDRRTGSLLAGWTFSGGTTVEWEITPLLGVAAGDTDAILNGVEFSLAWKQLDYYLEAEVAFDLHDTDDNFTYGWSELGWTPYDWMRVGLVGQRTRVVDTDLDVQRGVFAQGIVGHFTFGAYWFNPAGDDEFVVALLEVDF